MPKNNYMKYWRTVRYYTMRRYNLREPDLDLLFFLYDEGYFLRSKFDEFSQIIPWDTARFDRLQKEGWIEKFSHRTRTTRNRYSLSMKARRVIEHVYRKLNGEPITEDPAKNPMFKKKVNFADKVHRNFMKEMNKYLKEQGLYRDSE